MNYTKIDSVDNVAVYQLDGTKSKAMFIGVQHAGTVGPDARLFHVEKFIQLLDYHKKPGTKLNVLVLGLGPGAITGAVLEHHPGSDITYIEKDPNVIEMWSKHFASICPDCPVKSIICGDANKVIAEQPADCYDLVVVDAFDSDSVNDRDSLGTKTMVHVNRVLKTDGIIAINTIIPTKKYRKYFIHELDGLFKKVVRSLAMPSLEPAQRLINVWTFATKA